jgi:CDP-paratose 2-epimerase
MSMAIAIVTGSAGLVGSETCRYFHELGLDVIGIDNDQRAYYFGAEASTAWNRDVLKRELRRYTHELLDIRDGQGIDSLFRKVGNSIALVVHAAAQPSHDWAAREPLTDFTVNAVGTLNLLEATRKNAPEVPFIFMSTNKVYGDTPNALPFVEKASRWEVEESHPYARHGIDETMSIDHSKHSLFGVSKASADLMVQEYGRYFGMKTGTFRGGCLTGPAHAGTELHGFLSYLVKCALSGRPYKIFGYKGKQVRDNIHSHDLVEAFGEFFRRPRAGAVYNIGGGRHSNTSMLEAIEMIADISGERLTYEVLDQARSGDHIWYISDLRTFEQDYPTWQQTYDIHSTLVEMIDVERTRQV